ncbi:MAG TPA: hypothetical protein VGY54_03200 [Polyangiaceae bacterium]|jgi:hypothetical protein|nr:hypothetical protein [Polyangiaceae bacterium]
MDPRFVFFPPLTCPVATESSDASASQGDDGANEAAQHDGANEAAQDEGGLPEGAPPDGAQGDGAIDDASSDDSATAIADAIGGTFVQPDPCEGVTTLDVAYTPQACRAFVQAEASGNVGSQTDPSAPVIIVPNDGDALTPDNWSIFVWVALARDSRRDPLRRIADWLEPSAHAYSPLRGDAYVLQFSQGCTEILRVMLAKTAWVPDAASWATLSSLTGPVQVRVFGMRFDHDVLVSKPIPSAAITITMTGRVDSGGAD